MFSERAACSSALGSTPNPASASRAATDSSAVILLPLREKVAPAGGRMRGLSPSPPSCRGQSAIARPPLIRRLRRHLLPQGEKEVEPHRSAATASSQALRKASALAWEKVRGGRILTTLPAAPALLGRYPRSLSRVTSHTARARSGAWPGLAAPISIPRERPAPRPAPVSGLGSRAAAR